MSLFISASDNLKFTIMSADKQPYNPRHEGAYNQEPQPSFNEVTEQDREAASERLSELIRRTREDLED